MRVFSAEEVDRRLDDLALVDRLDALFRAGCEMPTRHHHTLHEPNGPGSTDATLLLMPAWTNSGERLTGCKVVSVYPDNSVSFCTGSLTPTTPWITSPGMRPTAPVPP